MNNANRANEMEIIENAMAGFLSDLLESRKKSQSMRRNMECRRKLELKWEEQRLARETCEYDFA